MILSSYSYLSMDDVREALKIIGDTIESERKQNGYLNEKIKELTSEHYKDEELAKMKAELETARADLRRGFEISEREDKDIENWIENHENTVHGGNHHHGVSGGGYKFVFYPTGLGTSGVVRCCICGEEHEFQEIG